jgi:hypothetical protein
VKGKAAELHLTESQFVRLALVQALKMPMQPPRTTQLVY